MNYFMCGFSINDVFCLDLRIYIFYFIYIVDHILSSQILSTWTTRIFKALIDSVYKKLTLKLIGIIGFNNNNKISSRYFSSVVNIIYVIWFKPYYVNWIIFKSSIPILIIGLIRLSFELHIDFEYFVLLSWIECNSIYKFVELHLQYSKASVSAVFISIISGFLSAVGVRCTMYSCVANRTIYIYLNCNYCLNTFWKV